MEVVGVGMVNTGKHLTHNNTLKAATNSLNLLKTLDLKADVS